MKKMKIITGLLLVCYSFAVMTLTVYAQEGTVLPDTQKSIGDCKFLMNEVGKNACWVQKMKFNKNNGSCTETGVTPAIDDVGPNDILACGIKTGTIHMWMVPYYIRYILEFIIGIAGLVSVGGIVYGGYLYLFAGISQDKDKGKKAIQYSVLGMIMTLTAWALVNIIIALVTS